MTKSCENWKMLKFNEFERIDRFGGKHLTHLTRLTRNDVKIGIQIPLTNSLLKQFQLHLSAISLTSMPEFIFVLNCGGNPKMIQATFENGTNSNSINLNQLNSSLWERN